MQQIMIVQAQRAFKGIVMKWLERVFNYLKIEGLRPTLERDLVKIIVLHVLPHLHDKPQELETILSFRFKPSEKEVVPSALTPEEIQNNSKDFVDDRDLEDLKQVAQQVAAGRQPTGTPAAQSSGGANSGSAGSAAAASGPKPNSKVAPVWDEREEFSIQEARKLFPRDGTCALSRDDNRHYRWVIAYVGGSQSVFTKAWNDVLSPRMALKTLLLTVWAEHERLERGNCPHDLDDIFS